MAKDWISRAIRREGRVHRYLHRLYGSKAFTRNGHIKVAYINRAIEHVKKSRLPEREKRSLLSALYLAKRLKHMRKR